MAKSLKQLLEENGYQQPPDQCVDLPERQEPQRPRKRWMTIGDLFCGCGSLFGLLGTLLSQIIAIVLWLLGILVLLQILVGGCRG